jgi:hypothetical protein
MLYLLFYTIHNVSMGLAYRTRGGSTKHIQILQGKSDGKRPGGKVSSEMLCCIVWKKFIDVLEVHPASTIWAI